MHRHKHDYSFVLIVAMELVDIHTVTLIQLRCDYITGRMQQVAEGAYEM